MLSIRKAVEADCKLYFNWVNDPETRMNSVNTNEIDWEGHRKWFADKLVSQNTFMFVLLADETPVGQIRFEVENKTAIISFSIDKKYRGNNYGRNILAIGTKKIIEIINKPLIIAGQVKKTNIASIKAFQYCDFTISSEDSQYYYFQFVSGK